VPTVVIVHRQSAQTTEAGGPRGYDAGKDVKRRSAVVAAVASRRPI
jgi:hypothetical protein